MIISLRGTNGAGKSTIVRRIMGMYETKIPLWMDGRRKPTGYHLHSPSVKSLHIPGHYEIANGGIDTLKHIDDAYAIVKECSRIGMHVLYEGKNMTDGTKRVLENFTPEEITIVVVDHPVDDCIQAVRDRGHSIKEETIRRIARKVEKDAIEFKQLGYTVITGNRDEAFSACLALLQ